MMALPPDDNKLSFLGRPLFDKTVGALETVGVFRSKVHAGKAFSAPFVNTSLGAGATQDIEIVIPNSGFSMHLYDHLLFTDIGELEVELLEAPTITDGSTEVPILNRNRRTGNASQVTIYSDPTSISGGTQLERYYRSASFLGGGAYADTREWEFAPGTKYLFRFTNNDGSSGLMVFEPFWFEERID